ncbi:DUF4430 domain-containing protein [Paratractidigestivibacter sp.]|uniref:DUF4430 domain-containing protein n=1 Tax=Paratractidigestivibacter sp. TaxID=2847316 RepID=UPI003A8D96AE
MAEPNSNIPGDEGKKGARVWRPVVAVIAAVAIVFCAWSAWQYAQGDDPLAFLSGDALQTVSEPAAADGQAASTPQVTMTANTVTADDVAAACAGLSFDGSDVSVAADDVKAVLTANGVWVEQATTDDAPAMVDATARRAAALAKWAAEQNVGLADVTWISEDANGAVRLVVRYGCDGAPTSGDASALLSAAEGYAISGDAYAQLGGTPAFAQQGGEAPTLPDDSAITVVQKKTVDGEALSKTKTTYRVVDQNGKNVSSKSSSGGSTSSSSQRGALTVNVTVDGSAGGAGSGSATVSLPEGSTVYDALVATGVDVNARMTTFGMYVAGINGLSEKATINGINYPGSGWVYYVDGNFADRSSAAYQLADGMNIYWCFTLGKD